MLLDKEALIEVAEIITSRDFYRETHQHIFQTLMDLFNKGEAVDLVTVCEELENKGLLDKLGGAAYLATPVSYTHLTLYGADKLILKATKFEALELLQSQKLEKKVLEMCIRDRFLEFQLCRLPCSF